MHTTLNRKKLGLIVLSLIYIFSVLFMETHADPVGAQITNITSMSGASAGDSRTDEGGKIHIITVSATQQNYAWKAYVGNMTASLTLDDSNGRTIYDWTIVQTSLSGELYATRNGSVSWVNLACANQTTISAEYTVLNMGAADGDNINNTFRFTQHPAYTIAGQTLGAGSCKALFTYINDTIQADDVASFFSEIVIQNGNGNLIYVTKLYNDLYGYSGQDNATYDFQLLIPDNDLAAQQTTYYFYAEIDS